MKGVEKLLKDLEAIKKKTAPSGGGSGVPKGLRSLCSETVDAMANVNAYKNAVYLKYELTDDGAKITATHPQLGFIEFGTGINFNGASEYGAKLGFIPASWSQEHSQWLTDPQKLAQTHGFWPAPGGWTQGHPPADAFGLAAEMIRKYATERLAEAMK